ncbi:MAG: hypothetical protein ACK4SQ_07960 [Allorhizobium sp.]
MTVEEPRQRPDPADLPKTLRTPAARYRLEAAADKYLAANDNTPRKGRAPVFRGERPAFNWAAKQDDYGAACLWMIARQRLPIEHEPANDNKQQGGLDVRKNGVARGKSKFKASLGEHLSIPGAIPPLGSAEPQPVTPAGHSRVETKDQDLSVHNNGTFIVDRNLTADFRSFGSCADALPTHGCDFIGAESGLGTPRPGKSKGSPLRAEDPEFATPPPEIEYVLELILARENVAGIGKAFGAMGRYQDKKGAKLIRAAMAWAKEQIAETNFRPIVTNRVAQFSYRQVAHI